MYCTIEGNIGSGKSTLVQKIQEFILSKPDCPIVKTLQEPVHEWLELKDTDGDNILSKFYKDTPRWAYSFQMNAFITRSKDIELNRKSLLSGQWMIGERSVITDRNVFAKLLNETGKIGLMEWKLYNQWYNWLLNDYKLKPDVIFYLYASPEISYDRLIKRSREEENNIKLDYLNELSIKHIDWLVPDEFKYKLYDDDWTYFSVEHPHYSKVIVLNGNKDLKDNPLYYDELADIIIHNLS